LWPDRIVHHGWRVLLLFTVATLITLLFPPRQSGRSAARFPVGSVAPADGLGEVDFEVPKPPDELQREREEVARGVPPTFDAHPEAADTMAARLARFFDRADSVAELADAEAMARFLADETIVATPDQAALLLDDRQRRAMRQAALRAVREYLVQGVVESGQAGALTTGRLYLRAPDGGERTVGRDEVLTAGDFLDRAVELLMTASPDARGLFRLILLRHTEYTLAFNPVATEADRDAARRTVATSKARVLRGEAIVRANSQITEDIAERLAAHEAELRRQGLTGTDAGGTGLGPLLGAWLLYVLLLGVYGVFVFFVRTELYARLRWLVLQAVLVVAYFAAAAAIARNGLPGELLPITFVALAVAVLWDSRMALVLALVLAGVTGSLEPFRGGEALFLVIMGGAAAAMSVRVVVRRSQTWVFIAIIAAAYAATIGALALVGATGGAGGAASGLLWACSNAAVSAILAMGFMPVFEWFTGVTTDQTLLEWADPNRPLLRRLAMEAPGTWAHTLAVANLCEMAASAIGANGLLCRAGIYYHDVGKVLKPHYFVENQPQGRNPHDKLKPHTSAQIVREHVLEGLRLAREARVPDVVAAFIPEHHGTQLISYFYAKAQEEAGEEPVDEADFRYPGPKPQSKETAIAMLADSVESATRVLQDPTEERVRTLISSIVDAKIADGQLDETPLTLAEISAIKEQFVKVLGSTFHHRIDYPTTRHLTESPDATEGGGEGGAPDGAPDGAGREGGDGAAPAAAVSEPAEASPDAAPAGEGPPVEQASIEFREDGGAT